MKSQFRRAAATFFFVAVGASSVVHAASISGQGTWETTLQGRDLDGNLSTFEAYYDTVLNVTWLADANYAGTLMNWADANSWASSLNINGITGWRLPTVSPIDGTTADDFITAYDGTEDRGLNVSAPGTLYAGSTASELAHMFYNTLGNLSPCNPSTTVGTTCSPQTGQGLSNTGPFTFSNDPNYTYYWSGTQSTINTNAAWYLRTSDGIQDYGAKLDTNVAWAVHTGDVSAVPVPAAVWLFGSGLLGLTGMARRKAA
jgi:hypothetical protein